MGLSSIQLGGIALLILIALLVIQYVVRLYSKSFVRLKKIEEEKTSLKEDLAKVKYITERKVAKQQSELDFANSRLESALKSLQALRALRAKAPLDSFEGCPMIAYHNGIKEVVTNATLISTKESDNSPEKYRLIVRRKDKATGKMVEVNVQIDTTYQKEGLWI